MYAMNNKDVPVTRLSKLLIKFQCTKNVKVNSIAKIPVPIGTIIFAYPLNDSVFPPD